MPGWERAYSLPLKRICVVDLAKHFLRARDCRSDTDEINYIPDFTVACNPGICDDRWICNPELVEQSQLKRIVFRRASAWRPQIYAGTDAVLELRSIGLSVPLPQIYAKILRTA